MLWEEVTIKHNKTFVESFTASGGEYGPIAVDSWTSPSAYICMVSNTVHMADRLVWNNIWDNKVRSQMNNTYKVNTLHPGATCCHSSSNKCKRWSGTVFQLQIHWFLSAPVGWGEGTTGVHSPHIKGIISQTCEQGNNIKMPWQKDQLSLQEVT